MNPTERVLPVDFFIDLDRTGPVPLYHQVAEVVRRAIADGDIPAGSRLENETAFAVRIHVSRMTIRRAVHELIVQGLVVRRRGVGTVVLPRRVHRDVELTSLFEDLQRAGQTPRTDVLGVLHGEADGETAETLGVEMGSRVVSIRRLRYASGIPIAILDNLLPAAFAGLEFEALAHTGLYPLLRARGVGIRVAQQRIGARAATRAESDILGISADSALLSMSRTAFDDAGRVVEHGSHVYRSDLYAFHVALIGRSRSMHIGAVAGDGRGTDAARSH